MSVHLHIGAHKTATSHLQQSLRGVARALAEADIAFLGPRWLRAAPHDLRSLLNDPKQTSPRACDARDLLRWQIASHARVVMSDELIQGDTARANLLGSAGKLYPRAAQRLDRLASLLGESRLTVYLAIRDPADFLISAFGEELREGRERLLEEYLSSFAIRRAGWSDLVERLLAIPQVAELVCWRFEDYAGIRADLLRRLVGPELAPRVPDLPLKRPGWTLAAYDDFLTTSEGRPQREWPMLARASRQKFPKRAGGDSLALLADVLPPGPDYARDCDRIAAKARVVFLRPLSEQA